MSSNRIKQLLANALSPGSVRITGIYTDPKTYGVYEIPSSSSSTRRFRFGNHPVRQTELERDYGKAEVVAVLADREQAKELAQLLNA